MKFKILPTSFAMLSTLAYTQAYADANYDIKSVISMDQMKSIIASQMSSAPAGTKVTNIDYQGYITLTDDKYFKGLDIAVKYTVTTKIVVVLTGNVLMRLVGNVSDLNCNNAQVTNVSVEGDGSLIGPISDYIKENKLSIFRDGYIAQSDIAKYCKIKPKQDLMNFNAPLMSTFEESILNNIYYDASLESST